MTVAASLALVVAALPPLAAAATTAAMPSDFDGDGYADLAIGVPGESREAGAVNVLYGSATGLTPAGDQYWTQDSAGVKGVSGARRGHDWPGDRFGWALAAGDFDGDGYADLAIGAPWDDPVWLADPPGDDEPTSGAVNVLYGSSAGLSAAGDQLWSRDVLSVGGATWYNVGAELAPGDVDGDGYWDLVVGARSLEATDQGVTATVGATVLYGGPGGLSSLKATTLTLEIDPDTAGYKFWHLAMATGDLDGDEIDDLAVGDPYARVSGVADAGDVSVFFGDVEGLSPDPSQTWTQDSPGIEGEVEAIDRFGGSLAIGDFDGDGIGDLAIGIACEGIQTTEEGAVAVIYGSISGPAAEGSQLWHQDVPGVPDLGEAEDNFGSALTAGDFDADGADDLAIGVPGEDPGVASEAWGAVITLYGSTGGLGAARSQLWTQASAGVPNAMERGDAFGSRLASAKYGRSGSDDLAIGVAGENLGGVVNAGMVNVLYARASGLSGINAQGWWQNSAGVKGTAQRDDLFGWSATP